MYDENARVLIVDDHAIVRSGLKALLDQLDGFSVVGEAEDGEEALRLAEMLDPEIVLMDIVMPRVDGVKATRSILDACPRAKVLAITSFGDEDKVLPILKAGAVGYILKNASPGELVHALHRVKDGGLILDPSITQYVVDEIRKSGPNPNGNISLTDRETEVLKLVATGLTNNEIAEKLFLGESTIRTYVSSILFKLGLRNRVQATLYALREGISHLR